jgi:hypothetical protein
MAKRSISRRLKKLADQIEETEFQWSPAFGTRPDETRSESLPLYLIAEDINEWLSKDEVERFAIEPAGSDYFQRAWKNTGEFKKARSYFKIAEHSGLTSDCVLALHQGDFDYAKKAAAEAEHLDSFRGALRYQHECAQAARAYAQTRGKEHHKELIAFDSPNPKNFEEALDLHLIDVGKYDPLLKHHIHAACHNAVHLKGTTPTDVAEATFDAVNFDRYFARLEGHLRNNINTVGDIIKTLSRYRERIDEASHAAPQRQR